LKKVVDVRWCGEAKLMLDGTYIVRYFERLRKPGRVRKKLVK